MLNEEVIVWEGDLSDDCTAYWQGLILRAEWMDRKYWWWAVSDLDKTVEVDSSNEYEELFIGGDSARRKAEAVARAYRNAFPKKQD